MLLVLVRVPVRMAVRVRVPVCMAVAVAVRVRVSIGVCVVVRLRLAVQDVIEQVDARHNAAHNLLDGHVRGARIALLRGHHQRKVVAVKQRVQLRQRGVKRDLLELTVCVAKT